MEDWIYDLDTWARELLADAKDLDEKLNEIGKAAKPNIEQLGNIEKLLGTLCKNLTNVAEVLRQPTGPLTSLIEKLDGAKVSTDAPGALVRFLTSHERMLIRIGVPTKAIDALLQQLKSHMSNSLDRLEAPQTITPNDGSEFIEQVKSLSKLICEIHSNAELFNKAFDFELLKECVHGVIGTCLIVVDITGALTAPHVTVFVLVKAVKSTWSGYRMVKRSVGIIKDKWQSFKGTISTLVQQDAIRTNFPPSKPIL